MRQVLRDREVHPPAVQSGEEAADATSPTLPAAAHSINSVSEPRPRSMQARRLGWAGVGGLVIGAGVLVVTGHPEIGALAGAASLVAAGWMLGYRGRAHRWPGLLNEAKNRDATAR